MRKNLIYWGLVILWCFMIYQITASPAATSESTTSFLKSFPLPPTAIDIINYCIRKAAHVTLFGILAALILLAMGVHKYASRTAWLLATFYGATDEIHQLYAPGRTSSIIDVGIDSFGALAGIITFMLMRKWFLLLNNRLFPNKKRKSA